MRTCRVSIRSIVGTCVILAAGLLMLSGAGPRTALAHLTAEDVALTTDPHPVIPMDESGTAWLEAASGRIQSGAPAVTMDEHGYTLWTVDWSWDDWCVPYSRIAYPIDLEGYDTSAFEDISLTLTYSQRLNSPHGFRDPTWTVAMNGKPPQEWRAVGALSGPVSEQFIYNQWHTAEIPFDEDGPPILIDGENRMYLRQHDSCPTTEYPDSACTCINGHTMQLRAAVGMMISSVGPEDNAQNLPASGTPITVKFTQPVREQTLNSATFQVYTYDRGAQPVYVNGAIQRKSANEYAFVPSGDLLAGVRYHVTVWGEEDAQAAGSDSWVIGDTDLPLERGRTWSFWTLPDLKLKIVPVQVLEDMPLIANKDTALRVFIRWDEHANVSVLDQVRVIELQDLQLRWQALAGSDSNFVDWRDNDSQWNLPFNLANARRKREYLAFSDPVASYGKAERQAGRDSITYFGFSPVDAGTYTLTAFVTLLDHEGEPTITRLDAVQRDVIVAPVLNIHHRAGAVGTDYGASGTVNLALATRDSLDMVRALFPVPTVSQPPNRSAIPYYHPSTSLYVKSWASNPWWPYTQHAYLLQELSGQCALTTGCNFMIGYVPQDWMGADYIGTTERWIAPQSALLVHDVVAAYDAHFAMAHELGHLYQFDTHDDALRGGEGYMVSHRVDQRYTVSQMSPKTTDMMNNIKDFMNSKPETVLLASGGRYACRDCVWINPSRYRSLITKITGVTFPLAVSSEPDLSGEPDLSSEPAMSNKLDAATAPAASPMLMVSGVITPATGETFLMPWYQLDLDNSIPPVAGPYRLVFLDAAGQAIAGHTHSFDVSSDLHFDGFSVADAQVAGPAWFLFTVPYPQNAARIQIRRASGNVLLAERTVSASAPSLTLHAPPAVWTGRQTITWDATSGTFFALSVSTDGGATWEGLALNFDEKRADLETISLPNTTQAHIRVAATDGVRTRVVTRGPFTIANPPVVSFVSPPEGSVADPGLPIVVGFRDAMNAATITAQTITLSGGPHGAVSGVVTYDAAVREATFTPHAPLAYDTTYTGRVTTGVRDSRGVALPSAFTWTFTTARDAVPPVPLAFSPVEGALNAPLNTPVIVLWDKALNPATVTAARFTLATHAGTSVPATVSYDAAARATVLVPGAALQPNTRYVVTLGAGIADTAGNATRGTARWAFRTGAHTAAALGFTGAYSDWGVDTDGNGRYEHLAVRVGVRAPAAGTYTLRAALADGEGGEIVWAEETATLAAGSRFITLNFDGAQIGGRGTDGPYTLTRLTLAAPDGSVVGAMDAHRTFAYAAGRFLASLRFGGLPDLLLRPETTLNPAFNVRTYAQHPTQPAGNLTYSLLANTNPRLGVTLDAQGNIRVNPEPGWGIVWTGSTLVTVQASHGQERVQDTFRVTVGWRSQIYLPAMLRQHQPGTLAAAHSYWQLAYREDFERTLQNWSYWSEAPVPLDIYRWERRDCAAHSGQYSMWAYGLQHNWDRNVWESQPCGAHYTPGGHTTMSQGKPINLRHTSQAEFRAKVWTDFAPGGEVCVMVSISGSSDLMPYGVCRGGKTNGWEDLVLDLSKVPTLGSLLGKEAVLLRLQSRTMPLHVIGKESRPVGAYIDDVEVWLCPQGLDCNAPRNPAPIPVGQATVAGGSIGGYTGDIVEVALVRETNGRIHALWTGKLNPHFASFVYYATSPDGQRWTPFTVVNYHGSNFPRIALDEARQRVHLMYQANNSIVHHTIEKGVISLPVIVAAGGTGSWEGAGFPSLTVAPQTGHVHALWLHGYTAWTEYPRAAQQRYRTWYAYWDGKSWSPHQRIINDDDTMDSHIVAGTDGGLMLAWFQRFHQSQPRSHLGDEGEPTVPRTAYGLAATPGRFSLRQSVPFAPPRGDDSLVLTYSAGAGKYYMFNWHRMWPGYSVGYRYVWENGTWSDPINVAQNAAGYVRPIYIGAATHTPLIRYVYNQDWTLKMRTETNGVLGSVVDLAEYLSARGYSGAPGMHLPDAVLGYFTDAAGNLHLVLNGEKNGVAGFYYVSP
jgi:hypothetical protein